MLILSAKFLNDLPLSDFADKHSMGTSPESGLHIYFSASFHFEFKVNPSREKHSQLLSDLACSAAQEAAPNIKTKQPQKLPIPSRAFSQTISRQRKTQIQNTHP